MATHRCPTCRKPVAASTERPKWAPFCSERCKLVDLQKWLGGVYVVPVEDQPKLDDEHEVATID